MSLNKKRSMYNHKNKEIIKNKSLENDEVFKNIDLEKNNIEIKELDMSIEKNKEEYNKKNEFSNNVEDISHVENNQNKENTVDFIHENTNNELIKLNNDIEFISEKINNGEVVDVESYNFEKKQIKAHYQLRRNPETKSVEIFSNYKKEVKKVNQNQTKKDVANAMLQQTINEIYKAELEIEINKEILKNEKKPNVVNDLNRHVDNYSVILYKLNKKQQILTEIIKNL